MDFRTLTKSEQHNLLSALNRNADKGEAILMNRSTNFIGTSPDLSENEVFNAIKSVPCHY